MLRNDLAYRQRLSPENRHGELATCVIPFEQDEVVPCPALFDRGVELLTVVSEVQPE